MESAISSIEKIGTTLILGTLVIAQTFSQTSKEHERAEALLRQVFPEAAQCSIVTVPLRETDRDSLRAITKHTYASDTLQVLTAFSAGKTLGYAIVDDVRGKDQPITYCVVVDGNLIVQTVEILVYREPYGGEVRNTSWLRQFFNKKPEDHLRPGREIRNITGATISARSVTAGVKNVLTLLRIVQKRLPPTTGETR